MSRLQIKKIENSPSVHFQADGLFGFLKVSIFLLTTDSILYTIFNNQTGFDNVESREVKHV